jgi:hypothetical protein
MSLINRDIALGLKDKVKAVRKEFFGDWIKNMEPEEYRNACGELDKALEGVQSNLESAGLHFLRFGDCAERISKIREGLENAKELAEKELARMQSPALI